MSGGILINLLVKEFTKIGKHLAKLAAEVECPFLTHGVLCVL